VVLLFLFDLFYFVFSRSFTKTLILSALLAFRQLFYFYFYFLRILTFEGIFSVFDLHYFNLCNTHFLKILLNFNQNVV